MSCSLPGCRRRRFVLEGVEHDFCGRTHAIEAAKRGLVEYTAVLPGSSRMCAYVQCNEPVAIDEVLSRVYDYCSLYHRDLARDQGQAQNHNTSHLLCMLEGCGRKRYLFTNGSEMDFCGKTHALLYQERQVGHLSQHLVVLDIRGSDNAVGSNNRQSEQGEGGDVDEESEEDEESAMQLKAIEERRSAIIEISQRRAREAEEARHGRALCAHCKAVLCPLSWLGILEVTEEDGRSTANCVVNSDRNWKEMKVILKPHPEPTQNKSHKTHCAKCHQSVGTLWKDECYYGPRLKAIDILFQLPNGKETKFRNWRNCPYLSLSQQQPASKVAAFTMQQLETKDERFVNIESQFRQSWATTHERKFCESGKWIQARLTAVYEVLNRNVHERFLKYQRSLGQSQVKRLYHGTTQAPNCLFIRGIMCSANCALCSICKNGFKMSYCKTRITNFSRFGEGIYFGPTPAKSHDYTNSREIEEGNSVLLLCNVELGRCSVERKDREDLTSPPSGYDSVWARTKKGGEGNLNFSERVVYVEAAASVCYVLFYQFKTHRTDPHQKLSKN